MDKKEAEALVATLDESVRGLLEDIARAIAKGHFMRKRHYGIGTQEEAALFQVERGWRNFLPDALFVMETLHHRGQK